MKTYTHATYKQRQSSSLLLISLMLCYSGGSCLLVKTSVGGDAVLPCEVDPSTDATDQTVYWSRTDLPHDQYVHFQRDRQDLVDHKHSSYKGRTSLFRDELKNGNVSLKLSRVKSSDEGIYSCFIPESQEEHTIQLIVERNIPGQGSRTGSNEMNLSCFTTTNPHSVNVTNIYDDLVDTGSLWNGEPSSITVCSDTSFPASSHCVPCVLDWTVRVVCKDIPRKVKLLMEAEGRVIDNIKADYPCPRFSLPSSTGDFKKQERHVKETAVQYCFWGGLIIAFTIYGIISVGLYKKRQSILEFGRKFCRHSNPSDTKDRPWDGVSEVSPMNGLPTNQV